jgi:membrane protease YdiL (CAAX protease family)
MSSPRDLLVFCGLTALPIAGFLLLNYPNAQFDVSLYMVSMLVLLWFRVYQKETTLVAFDHDLDMSGLVWIVAGLLGCLVVASFLVRQYTISSIYVPMTKLSLAVGTFQLPQFASDLLFTLALVAPAEEAGKLVAQTAFYTLLKDSLGKTFGKAVSIAVPIGTWALLHTYQNPAYATPFIMFTIFIAGGIIYAVMWKTKSLLAAILVHAAYNSVILYLQYYH